MKLDEFIAVGKIHRPHGIRGWLKVSFNHPLLFSGDGDAPAFFFAGNDSSPLPYEVEELNYATGNHFLLKLVEFDDREAADKLAGKELFLTAAEAPGYFDLEDQGFDFTVGYTLMDQDGKKIGEIHAIMAMPQQDLAEVDYEGREVLIPLVPENILSLDRKKKTIRVDIPDGLLDL